MLSLSAVSRYAETREQVLIIRLITIVGLSLLLLFGVATASHGELNDGSAVSTSSTVYPGAMQEDSSATAVVSEGADAPSAEGGSAGSVLCALGMLCGLFGTILLLRILQRRLIPLMHTAALHPVSLSSPETADDSCASVVSLTQIAVSRT